MPGFFDFRPDPLAIDRFLDDNEHIEDAVLEGAEAVAEIARGLAPRVSGSGAASIHAEVHRGAPPEAFASTYVPEDENEPIGYAGWDQDHYYMGFVEDGTEFQAPQPFMRPALDQAQM